MQVKVANRVYRMSQNEYLGLLRVASEQVSFGVYAVERNGYAELRCDRCSSITQLKKMVRQYRSQGFKVYVNSEKEAEQVPIEGEVIPYRRGFK